MASIQEDLKTNLLKKNINFIPMTNAGCDFLDYKNVDATKTNFKDAATISFMIVVGEYLANIGYVRGLIKYWNTKWVV